MDRLAFPAQCGAIGNTPGSTPRRQIARHAHSKVRRVGEPGAAPRMPRPQGYRQPLAPSPRPSERTRTPDYSLADLAHGAEPCGGRPRIMPHTPTRRVVPATFSFATYRLRTVYTGFILPASPFTRPFMRVAYRGRRGWRAGQAPRTLMGVMGVMVAERYAD